jgi:hypothetical protein
MPIASTNQRPASTKVNQWRRRYQQHALARRGQRLNRSVSSGACGRRAPRSSERFPTSLVSRLLLERRSGVGSGG